MKEKIEAKLKEIAAQREQLIAQVNALIGAEQVLRELLDTDFSESHDEQNS